MSSDDYPTQIEKQALGEPCKTCIAWGPTAGLGKPSVPCPVCKRRVAPTIITEGIPAPVSTPFALTAFHRMRRAASYNKGKKK